MSHLDLNLVRVFVAIYETRSVTHAAERLDVTQSTVSYALAKLRKVYLDRLFSRGSDGLVPTGMAEQLFQRTELAATGRGLAIDEVHILRILEAELFHADQRAVLIELQLQNPPLHHIGVEEGGFLGDLADIVPSVLIEGRTRGRGAEGVQHLDPVHLANLEPRQSRVINQIAALRRHRAAGRKANQGEGNRNGFSAGINRVCCKHPGHRLLKGIHALSLSCAHE